MAGTRQFQSIQILRAIAAVMVVTFHAGLEAGLLQPERSDQTPHWLASGVDIFFVISGFVMIVSTEARNPSPRAFIEARLVRIAPPYWVATAALIALMALRSQPLPGSSEIIKSALFIFYDNPRFGATLPILAPGWSLNYEVFFYLIFAALIYIPALPRIALMGVLFCALAAARPFAHDGFAVRMTSPIPLEFVAGMMIGHYRRWGERMPAWTGVAAMMAFFIILASFHPRLPRTVLFGPLAAGIVAAAVVAEPLARSEALRFAKRLGDASYSLYLGHAIVIAVLTFFLPRSGGTFVWATMVIASIAFSLPMYSGEKRLTSAVRLLLPRKMSVNYSPVRDAA